MSTDDKLNREQTQAKILSEFDARLWKTDNGDLQLRLYSRYEAEAVRAALSVPSSNEPTKGDVGPWRIVDGTNDVTLYSDDFEHDVMISINGDFADNEQRRAYAENVAKRLSVQSAIRDTGPLKLDNERQVFFYEQDHYYLSNFAAFSLDWQGKVFPTSEHAYQFTKFSGEPDVQELIYQAPSAHEAFKLAEKHRVLVRSDWEEIKVRVMRGIVSQKAAQHEYVRRKLLQTGDRELIENSWRDGFWGWGENRDGKNMLGKLWMEIRAELRSTDSGRKT